MSRICNSCLFSVYFVTFAKVYWIEVLVDLQQHNQTIALYSKEDLEKKLNYIHENPVVSRFVDHEEDYPYSSVVDYSGQKGLVDMVKLY